MRKWDFLQVFKAVIVNLYELDVFTSTILIRLFFISSKSITRVLVLVVILPTRKSENPLNTKLTFFGHEQGWGADKFLFSD